MKKIILITIATISIYCISCKKKTVEPNYDITYLELYNKPLDTIRHYLNGKWQVHKTVGGFAFETYYSNSAFIEFKFGTTVNNDSIKSYNDTVIIANSKATWSREYSNVYIGDTTYLLKYITKTLFSVQQIIKTITNDTLTISDNYPSGYTMYCTKVK